MRDVSKPILPDPIALAASRCFSIDYFEARRRFVAMATSCASYASSAKGPGGEALWTDAVWIGSGDAREVLVILSGLHGVEGYCGSAVQLDLMSQGMPRLGRHQAILLIHAANPYGFAWDRRVTEEGCDLNRNFIDFGAELPSNPDYPGLAQHLVPKSLDEDSVGRAEAAITAFRAVAGERAFQVARKSGQYIDAKGMFFGGFRPTQARRTLEEIAEEFNLAGREFVSVLDIHTGLGPFGYGEAQSEHQPESASHQMAVKTIGPALASPDLGTSYSVPVHGTAQLLFERILGDGRHLYLCLEFGTYDQERSRAAYRLDHWFYHYGDGDPHGDTGLQLRRTMRDIFNPDRVEWREMVIFRARQVIRQMLKPSPPISQSDLAAAL